MKLIASHPDLKDEGGVYVRFSVKEYRDIVQHAQLHRVEVIDVVERAIVQELATPVAELQMDVSLMERPTRRELDVLACLAEGKSNKEIAQALGISSGSVKAHLSHISEKTHLRGRSQLMIYYMECFSPAAIQRKAVSART